MSEKKYQELNSMALGFAFAAFGFLGWLVGFGWHGMMGQPTMVGMMYQGFSYFNPMWSGAMFLLMVIGGYISGEIIARLYNWFLKKNFSC